MLEHFMDPLNFQKGIQNFLKKYEYANAATPDLWEELQVLQIYWNQIRCVYYILFDLLYLENYSALEH